MNMKASSGQRGAAVVEFAIVLPLLLLIAFGIFEFGRAIYVYNTLVKATRDAARYYAAHQPGNPPPSAATIRNLAVYGNTTGTGAPLAPGLTTAMVTLCDWISCPGTNKAQGAAPVVNLVTVTITAYTFVPLVPYAPAKLTNMIFGDISTTMQGNI
jgi:Flp pilus assembly protein TadG